MSREKRAESCLNDSQSLPLNAQSPLLKAQSSLRSLQPLRDIILSVYESFIPLSIELETKLKKEETTSLVFYIWNIELINVSSMNIL